MKAQPYKHDPAILIVEIDDSINDDSIESSVDDLISKFETQQHRKIVGDCATLDFLSSYGMSLLLRMRNAVHAAGGEMKLCGVSVLIQRLFEMSKVSQLFPPYTDIEQARRSFTAAVR